MMGISIGALIGGAPGAAIGAALLTPVGIYAQESIDDTIQTANVESHIYQALRNAIAAGSAVGLLKWVEKYDKSMAIAIFQQVNKAFGEKIKIAEATVEATLYAMIKRYVKCCI
jgi:TnpA family transposase